jgi:hypothetical protein
VNRLLLFLLIITASSCARKINIDVINNDNILSSKSQVIETSAIISSSLNEVIVDKTKTTLAPAIGEIIIAAPSTNNEYGVLSKVVSSTVDGDKIIYKTEPAGLNEAFEQLQIDSVYTDSFTADEKFRTNGSISLSFSNENTLVNGLKFDGILKVNIPAVKVEYKKSSGSQMPERVLVQADINTEGSSLEITNTATEKFDIKAEKLLRTIPLPNLTIPIPVVTPIGPIVLPLILVQKIHIKTFPISLSGKLQWTTLPVITATLGAKYENGVWSNISTYSLNASKMDLNTQTIMPNVNLNASATIFNPVYEISPFGSEMLKGFFEVPVSVSVGLQGETPNITMGGNVDVAGGIKTKFWTGEESNFSISGNAIEKNFYQGNWVTLESPVITFQQLNNCKISTGGTGSTFIVSFKATDNLKILSPNNWQIVEQVGAQLPISFNAVNNSGIISYKGCLRYVNQTSFPMSIYIKTKTGIKSNQLNFFAPRPAGAN